MRVSAPLCARFASSPAVAGARGPLSPWQRAHYRPPLPASPRFNPDSNTYVPYGKEWIKTRVFQHLKRQAS